MSLAVGIVGLPNVGKSTLFRALTRIEADAANYPFCTIDPNVGIVPIHDGRFQALAELIQPEKCIPATLKVVDIAGLVQGASEGEGLGNQFLSHIREVHAIAHVVRCFEDENIAHVTGRPDPAGDAEVVETELILTDLGRVERKLDRLKRQTKGDKDASTALSVFERLRDHLGEGHAAADLRLKDEEKRLTAELQLLTEKPFFYVANVAETELKEPGPHFIEFNDYAEKRHRTVIPVCARLEAELSEMKDEEARLFLEDLHIERSGLDQVVLRGYELLNQITYFTVDAPELRAWEILKGTQAAKAAGKIHTDFERGFIRAEVYHWSDLMELGTEHAVKEAGKLRLEGRDYIVRDGDVMHFRFNV